MQTWMEAAACPYEIKEMLYRTYLGRPNLALSVSNFTAQSARS